MTKPDLCSPRISDKKRKSFLYGSMKRIKSLFVATSLFYIGLLLMGFWLFVSSDHTLVPLLLALSFVAFSWTGSFIKDKKYIRFIYSGIGMVSILIGLLKYSESSMHIIGIGFFLPLFAQYLFQDFVLSNLISLLTAYVFISRRILDSTHEIAGYISGLIIISALYSIVFFLFRKVVLDRDKYLELSNLDSLTGLYNLTYIIESGQKMLESRKDIFLVIADLDHFKQINDTYGHLAGNLALIHTAKMIKSSLNGIECSIGRFGGDEFVILLKNLSASQGYAITGRINDTLSKNPFTADPDISPIVLSCSVGIAYSKEYQDKKMDNLLHAADFAMYQNKYGKYQLSGELLLKHEPITKRCSEVLGTLKEKDMYTYIHSQFVAQYAELLGNALKLPSMTVRDLFLAGWLHDMGKILISSDILRKPDVLTESEYQIVKAHVTDGICILNLFNVSNTVKSAVNHHHERWDGGGYPFGLSHDDIPLEGRILAIADVFSAITIKRVYKQQMSFNDALAEIERCSGSQFDPELVEVFVSCLLANKAG